MAKIEGLMNRYQINSSMCDKKGNSFVILATLKGNYSIVKLLLVKGMDPNTQNNQGNTALHYACDV